ncbi:MAG: hypothetical protein PHY43_00785 [Verrucomicrobiales bacterium]|nr:hypothetical protein [Verrucomicrobiales bacterium]
MALLAGFAASEMMAGTLTNYATGDVLLCFRKGGLDMVVDIGPVATLTGASANQIIPVSQYNATQLGELGNNNNLNWSAFTWLGNDTLYVTSPRSSVDQQTAPWLSKAAGSQDNVALRMATIPVGSAAYNLANPNPNNTSTVVIEESASAGNANYPSGNSYSTALQGSYGNNFDGTFQGNPEKTTPNNFQTAGKVVRSDFYQMTPNDGYAQGTWLGYFELAPNGTMTYVAYPSTVPVIQSINRTNTTTTITYTAGLYGTYTLRGAADLATAGAATNWPAITTLTSGDNAVHTVTDTTTDDIKFYTITAQ